jgi:hypothetical protein
MLRGFASLRRRCCVGSGTLTPDCRTARSSNEPSGSGISREPLFEVVDSRFSDQIRITIPVDDGVRFLVLLARLDGRRELLEPAFHARSRRSGDEPRIDDDIHPHLLKARGRDQRRRRTASNAEAHVDRQRCVDVGRDATDVLLGAKRVREDDVGADVGERVQPPDRLVESVRLGRVGPRFQEHVRRVFVACVGRRLDLRDGLVERNDGLPRHVATPLRPLLVLDHDGRSTRVRQLPDRAMDVHRVSVAGVGVDPDRDIDRVRDLSRLVGDVR